MKVGGDLNYLKLLLFQIDLSDLEPGQLIVLRVVAVTRSLYSRKEYQGEFAQLVFSKYILLVYRSASVLDDVSVCVCGRGGARKAY